jgi:hypothetical protein
LALIFASCRKGQLTVHKPAARQGRDIATVKKSFTLCFREAQVVRILAVGLMLVLAFPGAEALANQAKANFTVGIVIGKATPRKRAAPRPALKTYTWNAAAVSVRIAGFRKPVRLTSGGGVYWFLAEREGRRYRIAVSVSTGAILKVARTA